MTKPRPIALREDEPYAAAAARIVRIRAEEVEAHREGALGTEEIEPLHDMRVATRRLRAALEVFEPCFPRQRFRACLREVKQLADALGERRDRDVTIVALDKVAAAVEPAERPGVESLVAVIRDEQGDANAALEPHVAPERVAALVQSLRELAAEAERRAGIAAPPAGGPDGTGPG